MRQAGRGQKGRTFRPRLRRRRAAVRLALGAGLVLVALTLPAAPAGASVLERPLLETFGSAAQPELRDPGQLAFDGEHHDLLAVDKTSQNETQKLTIEGSSALGGTYKLSFGGQSTGWAGEATLEGGEAGTGDLEGVAGVGSVVSGSTEVTEVTGTFAVGENIEAFWIRGGGSEEALLPPNTTITAVNGAEHKLTLSQAATANEGHAHLRAGSLEVTNVSGGGFTAGRAISGQGIPLGTTIEAVGSGTLTLSKVPSASGTGVALTAGSLEATGMHTTSGAVVAGERLSGTGIQPGTLVTAVNEGAGTFTFSLPPTLGGASTDLTADIPFDASRGEFPEQLTVAEALERLPAIGAGNVVKQNETGYQLTPTRRVQTIEFRNALGERPLETLTCDGSGLTGGSPTCTVTETAAGHPNGIFRYHPDGAPAPFSALGTNVIDGRLGTGGRPCAEEAASCDLTPQGTFGANNIDEGQVAIDESHHPATDGDIYISLDFLHVVDVFAPDGRYLAQITGYTEGGIERQFAGGVAEVPRGVAVDSGGYVYVADPVAKKIHKYAPFEEAGQLKFESVANFGVKAARGVTAGAGPTAGSIFVLGESAIEKLDAASGAKQCTLIGPGPFMHLSVDRGSGRLLTGFLFEEDVYEYDLSAGCPSEPLAKAVLPVSFSSVAGVAADPESHRLYVTMSAVHPTGPEHHIEVYGALLSPDARTLPPSGLSATEATLNGTVDPKGRELTACEFEWGTSTAYGEAAGCEEYEAGGIWHPLASPSELNGEEPVPVRAGLTGLSSGATYHYRLNATNAVATAEGADVSFVAPGPPLISEESAQGVATTEATLRAKINARGYQTTYRVEYGATEAYGQVTPVRSLGSTDTSAHLVTVHLEGLNPGSAYHFRFTADNTSAEFPGTGEAQGEDRPFATFAAFAPETGCPNQAFRTGASVTLPDCRAYEMVSPVDKEGGEIAVLLPENGERPAVLAEASPSGDRLTYGSSRAFGDSASAPYTAQYLAGREAGGWASHAISPPKGALVRPRVTLDKEFFHFSEDLCEGTLTTYSEPPLAEGAQTGYFNVYRRTDQLCGGAPGFEAVTTAKPAHIAEFSDGYKVETQGVAADGRTTIFAATDNLQGSGAPANTEERTQLYVKAAGSAGPPRYVCVLPGGTASHTCTAGSSAAGLHLFENRGGAVSVQGALSEDGRRVFWSETAGGNLEGKLYLRENPLGTGTECDPEAAEAPCTIPVSAKGEEESGTGSSFFWRGAADGSAALYATGGDLYTFTVEGETTQKIGGESFGVVGASKDLSRIYFASGEVLEEGGLPLRNQRGEQPIAKKPNLYLYEGPGAGSYSFIATLGAGDVVTEPDLGNASSATAVFPDRHNGQASADGIRVAFMSEAPLTGFDNTDARSPEPCGEGHPNGICDNEVFLYDATANGGEGRLICASCNPSGTRPQGRNLSGGGGSAMQVAARLPVYATTLYQPRALSADGRRLFFESQDPLTPRDSNGRLDVYQWEAPGEGRCTEASSGYSASAGGCVELISSGQSELDSEFVDASASGRDVFFSTVASLLPQDYGLVDIYDARVEGGQPSPEVAPAACEGEACQPAAAPPAKPNLGSAALEGNGNVREKAARRCPQGRRPVVRKGKARCVSKHAKRDKKRHGRHHRRTNRNRRAHR